MHVCMCMCMLCVAEYMCTLWMQVATKARRVFLEELKLQVVE